MSGRIRSIKPEWLQDERLAFASAEARVASIGLVLIADDYGNGRANIAWLRGQLFPGDDSIEKTREAIVELEKIKFIVLYEADGQSYFSIRNWSKHQRVDKAGKPRVPPPPSPDGPPKQRRAPRKVSRVSPEKERESRAVPENIPETPEKVPESLAPDLDHDHDQDPEGDHDHDHRAGGGNVGCPPDLALSDDEFLQIATGTGMSRNFAARATPILRAKFASDARRTRSRWKKTLITALTSAWNNRNERKKYLETGEDFENFSPSQRVRELEEAGL